MRPRTVSIDWRVFHRLALLLPLLLAGCLGAGARPAARPPADPERLLAAMSLEEKVGQLMVVAFDGTTLSAQAAQMVAQYGAGGVILFQQNLVDADQARALTAQLQAKARIPLLIGVDQEGGPVVRVTRGATIFPSQMALGATFSPDAAAAAASGTARELRDLGLNTNFGPVVDVNSNPRNPVIGVRSYGGDPALVGALATAAIAATQRAGVLAVAKHFPGHGDADVDSHLALPVIGQDEAHLQAIELPPFRAAIATGVDGIMTAHVVVPALENGEPRPATLSAAVLGYLRETLGYQGLIITDDLEMGAIVDDYGTAEAAKLAFEAGADLLLFRRNVAEQQRAHSLLVAAVKSGEVSPQRLDASVRRILRAKARRGLLDGAKGVASAGLRAQTAAPGATPDASHADPQSTNAAVARDLARRSVTLVKNAGGLLPLQPGAAVCVVFPQPEAINTVEIALPGTTADGPPTLGAAVEERALNARLAPIGFRPAPAEAAQAAECVRSAQVAILGTYNLQEYPAQAALIKRLAALGRPAVAVALRLPYDLGQIDTAEALLAVYSNRPVSLRAASDALFGQGPAPGGHLPVPVSRQWPAGFGLLDYARPDQERP